MEKKLAGKLHCKLAPLTGKGGGLSHHKAAEWLSGLRGREPRDHARASAEATGARQRCARAAERPSAWQDPVPRR